MILFWSDFIITCLKLRLRCGIGSGSCSAFFCLGFFSPNDDGLLYKGFGGGGIGSDGARGGGIGRKDGADLGGDGGCGGGIGSDGARGGGIGRKWGGRR